ncbi:uncharacterized protein LOC143071053 [Mytilus galloprovincialis]|uniref:uncharacterized protein LOC143071053 n=1 Tax=Mytilus galloprovincialis TaxID=29158 RepID=UPI003F7C9BD6
MNNDVNDFINPISDHSQLHTFKCVLGDDGKSKFLYKKWANDKFTTQCFDDIGSTYQVSLSSVSSPRDRTMSLKSITPSINSAFSGLVSSNSTPVYSNIWSHPGDVSQSNVQTSAFKPKTSESIKTTSSFNHRYNPDNFENDFKRGDGRKASIEHDNKIDNFETTVKIDDVTKIECVEKDYGIDEVKINDNESVVNDKNTQ